MLATKVRFACLTVFLLLLAGLALWLAWPAWVAAEDGNEEWTLTVTGRLVDAQGQGVREAHVTVLDQDAGREIGEGVSHADGSFSVRLEPFEGDRLAIRIVRPHFHHIEWVPSAEDVIRADGPELRSIFAVRPREL